MVKKNPIANLVSTCSAYHRGGQLGVVGAVAMALSRGWRREWNWEKWGKISPKIL